MVKRQMTEAIHQMALVEWARLNHLLLISIPNGGKRTWWAGRQETRLGLTAGVSDLFLSMPSRHYHGFWIEMKAPGKKPTLLQVEWLKLVRKQGYKAEWFDDWLKAKEAIENYLQDLL